jgi:hypothetical protein
MDFETLMGCRARWGGGCEAFGCVGQDGCPGQDDGGHGDGGHGGCGALTFAMMVESSRSWSWADHVMLTFRVGKSCECLVPG